MLTSQEIESLRRSHAMAPLAPSHVTELLETCAQLTKEREHMTTVLAALPESFADVRSALNELHRILRNPKGHGLVRQDDSQRALEYLALVIVLFRRLDDAAAR